MRKVNLRNVDPAIDDPDASTWCKFRFRGITARNGYSNDFLFLSAPHAQPTLTSGGRRELQASCPAAPSEAAQEQPRGSPDTTAALCDWYGSRPIFYAHW